jgi:glutathione S-transferase
MSIAGIYLAKKETDVLEYISIPEAIRRSGLRLVLSPGVPGPWGEAAKAIFDIKGIEYCPVAQNIGVSDETLRRWTGQESAPAAMFDSERPRTRWDEILLLAERLSPSPRLVPEKPAERADMFGLAHEICGEDGFGWNCRLCVFAGQAKQTDAGAPTVISADQLALFQARYGSASSSVPQAKTRVVEVLTLLTDRLYANRVRGSRYMIGDQLTALDIYWAVFSNLVSPIAHEHCPMPDAYRDMGKSIARELGRPVDAALISHRDDILRSHFKLPMRF